EAITPLSVVGYKPTPPVTYRTNFASGLYPYYAGTSVSKLADSYLNNEIIYTIKCKVNENFKGKTFQMIFNNMEISMNSDFEMVYPLEKSVNFTIVNTDIINTIVQYKLDPTYIITIPEKIIASDSLPVEISINGNVNLEPDKQVKISVSSGNIVLNRHKIVDQIPVIVPVEEAGTITANLRLGSNNTILSTDTIALFEFGQENLIKTKLYLDPIITTGKKAGMYIGNIIFNLSLINK
ncbi:MAG: hypothetical protein RR645_08150, partial [Clostridium sp.]